MALSTSDKANINGRIAEARAELDRAEADVNGPDNKVTVTAAGDAVFKAQAAMNTILALIWKELGEG